MSTETNQQPASAAPAPPAPEQPRPKRRRLRPFLLLLAFFLCLGGSGLLAVSLHQGLRGAVTAAAGFEPPVIPLLLELLAPPAEPSLNAGADDLALRAQAIEASVEALRAEIEAEFEALAQEPDVPPSVASALAGITAALEAAKASRDAAADRISSVAATAEQAQNEARHARGAVAALQTESGGGIKLLEADVRALHASHSLLREQLARMNGRLDALAGDIHLLARYGSGRPAQELPRRAAGSQLSAAPFTASMGLGGGAGPTPGLSSGASAAASPPQAELVQGRYRVGDYVGGWGVVTAIRKTPEGDHLVTPEGTVFAPRAGSPDAPR